MPTSNIRRLMARSGLTIRDVVSGSGLNERTIKGLLAGTQKPHARTLNKLAEGLGVEVDELFNEPDDWERQPFDQATNRTVQEVLDECPELFGNWTDEELDELFSRFGTGGELTRDGVLAAANAMNARRDVFDKIAVLMETEHADLLAEFVDMLYRRAIDLDGLS